MQQLGDQPFTGPGLALDEDRGKLAAPPREREDALQIELERAHRFAFADEISSFGPDVVVDRPIELRESVIRRLAGALGPAPEEASG